MSAAGEPAAAAAGQEIDSGRVWWPAGLAGDETVRVVFNLALESRPSAMRLEDYETRAPLDTEVVEFVRQGSGKWARWTAAMVRFKALEQRGRSFRWRLYG